MDIGNVIKTVIEMSLIMLVGFYFAGKNWFQKGPDFMSKYLVYISLPCNVLINIFKYVNESDQIIEMFRRSAGVYIVIIFNIIVGWACSCIFHVKRNRKGVLIGAVSFPNTLLMGFPVVEGVLGSSAMGDAIAFYLSDTILFWTLGTAVLLFFGENTGSGKKFIDISNLKKILSPSLYALAIAVIIVIIDIRIPDILTESISTISGSTTAISMVFIGSMIRRMNPKKGNYLKDVLVLFLTKFVILPITTFLVLLTLPIDAKAKLVIYIITIMPMAINFSILSHEYKCDSEYTAVVSSLMNILSLILVPIYIAIINHFQLFT